MARALGPPGKRTAMTPGKVAPESDQPGPGWFPAQWFAVFFLMTVITAILAG
jgi:hypothetical protein